jgi:hypothetical protein
VPRPDEVPEEFAVALRSLQQAVLPADVVIEEIPGPQRLAPYSAALLGEVRHPKRPTDDELSSGRLVVLYDPAGQDAWDGRFRLVALVRTSVDAEVGQDPMLADVAWSWLVDALAHAGVAPHAPGGTVTRVVSATFGSLAHQQERNELEIRASWTAEDPDLAPHLHAWSTLLRTAAGLPPLPDGVVPLRG